MSAPQPVAGLQAKYFTDDEIFRRVKTRIYFKTWQFACHQSQVAKPGDYFSFSIFDQDIVIVHGYDGQLRAMFNVCQHRGHRLVEGSGNKPTLTCPYHAWVYDLEGQLMAAPNSQSVAGFERTKICVPQIRLEDYLGFIFVNLDPDALPMEACYAGVRNQILELCPDLEMRVFACQYEADEGCNWLTAVENYNECYHCKTVHRDFAKGIIDPDSYSIAPYGEGQVLMHTSKATTSEQAWYDVGGSDYGSFFLWPSMSIQIYPGGVVNSYHWRPLAVDDVRVHRYWYSDDGEVDATLQKTIDLDRETTFAEDLVLVRNVQRGLKSMGYRPGPLVVDPKGGIDNELSIAKLHEWLRAAVD